MKRVLNLLVAVLGVVLVSPLLLVVAVVIRCTSKGPVFFRQMRVGQYNKDFLLYKFRTMEVDHKGVKSNLTLGEEDPRVTRVGHFLRRSKIDELPQLFNVIKGDINLVGPRPIMREFVEMYYEDYKPILACKPGITSNAAIYYRNEGKILGRQEDPQGYYRDVIMPKRIELNLRYVYYNTIWSDIRLIFLTVYCTITGKDYSEQKLIREPLLEEEYTPRCKW